MFVYSFCPTQFDVVRCGLRGLLGEIPDGTRFSVTPVDAGRSMAHLVGRWGGQMYCYDFAVSGVN